jgi:hypothetical protein
LSSSQGRLVLETIEDVAQATKTICRAIALALDLSGGCGAATTANEAANAFFDGVAMLIRLCLSAAKRAISKLDLAVRTHAV